MKKGITIHPTLYWSLNTFIIWLIVFSSMTVLSLWARYLQASLAVSSDYFLYDSVEPTKKEFLVWEAPMFLSKLERFRPTDMRFEDNLWCGFFTWSMSRYSQTIIENSNANIWKYEGIWRYTWELPTIPMVCQIRSASSARLQFWIITPAQKSESWIFYFTGVKVPVPAYIVPRPKEQTKSNIEVRTLPPAPLLSPPTLRTCSGC